MFSFGIILCQLCARLSFDPEELPRSSDFGLAVDLFRKIVDENAEFNSATRPPPRMMDLAFDCCKVCFKKIYACVDV